MGLSVYKHILPRVYMVYPHKKAGHFSPRFGSRSQFEVQL